MKAGRSVQSILREFRSLHNPRREGTKAGRWVAADALRELQSPGVLARFRGRVSRYRPGLFTVK